MTDEKKLTRPQTLAEYRRRFAEHGAPRFVGYTPKRIFEIWIHGCGNTIPYSLQPWSCDECTVGMTAALARSFEAHPEGPELQEELRSARTTLQVVIGHGTCYCDRCLQASVDYFEAPGIGDGGEHL